MEVGLYANMCDSETQEIMETVHPFFRALGKKLNGDYGGLMEHLWIDLELIQSHCKEDGSARYPFRLQKRVSGRGHFGLPPQPDKLNVGHFSVRPDFETIHKLKGAKLLSHIAGLVYERLNTLDTKAKKLGGFNSALFKEKFLQACESENVKVEQRKECQES